MNVKALVKIPVVDVAGQSLKAYGKDILSCYNFFPLAPDKGSSSCLRLHQLLFNQIVTIVREFHNGEVAVEVPHLIYIDTFHRKRNDYWMLKKDLIPLNALKKEWHAAIPFESLPKDSILILKAPWFEETTKKIFSAGSRFVREPGRDTEQVWAVRFLDFDNKAIRKAEVPKDIGLVANTKSFERAREIFLQLIKSWSHPPDGIIPYVYGGCSMTGTSPDKIFEVKKGYQCGLRAWYWQRPDILNTTPLSGFDCSGMIYLAAQIAGLPYYFKNTLSLTTFLKPLESGELLAEGDLIWYQGHVLVVSDRKKNLVIEAVGYDSGFGKVHEVPLHKVFADIKTFDQLMKVYFHKHFIRRLNKTGKPYRSVYRVKILKLPRYDSDKDLKNEISLSQ